MQVVFKRTVRFVFRGFFLLSLSACTLLGIPTESEDSVDSRLLAAALVFDAQRSQKSSAYGPILFHSHTTDFATYKLDWIEAGAAGLSGVPSMTLYTNQISVTSEGIKSAQMYGNRLIFINSRSGGNGSLMVFDPKNPGTPVATLTLGTYPQEMVVSGTTAYVPIQGTFSAADGQLLVLDLSNVDSPRISQTITTGVPQDPGDIVLRNGKLYIQREGQSGVDIFDTANNFSVTTMSTGSSPLRLVDSGSKVFMVGTGGGGNLTAFTTSSDASSISSFPDSDSNATAEKPVFGSYIAFAGGTGYVTLSDNGSFPNNPVELFTIDPVSGAIGSTAIDAGTTNTFVGAGIRGNYLYRVTNGTGSDANLTIQIQNTSGSVLNSMTVAKEAAGENAFMPY